MQIINIWGKITLTNKTTITVRFWGWMWNMEAGWLGAVIAPSLSFVVVETHVAATGSHVEPPGSVKNHVHPPCCASGGRWTWPPELGWLVNILTVSWTLRDDVLEETLREERSSGSNRQLGNIFAVQFLDSVTNSLRNIWLQTFCCCFC